MNTLLRVEPMANDKVREVSRAERVFTSVRERAGMSHFLAETPVFRTVGPMWRAFDYDGTIAPTSSNKHPFGPQKRKYLDTVHAAPASDSDEDQMINSLLVV